MSYETSTINKERLDILSGPGTHTLVVAVAAKLIDAEQTRRLRVAVAKRLARRFRLAAEAFEEAEETGQPAIEQSYLVAALRNKLNGVTK